MKIALFIPKFPPDSYGGVESYTQALAIELAKSGHAVTILCGTSDESFISGNHGIREEDDGIVIRRIQSPFDPNNTRTAYSETDAAFTARAGKVLSDVRADVLHVMNLPLAYSGVVFAAKGLGMPVFLTATDYGLTCARHTLRRWDGSLCDGYASRRKCVDCLRPRRGRSEDIYPAMAMLPDDLAHSMANLALRTPLRRIGLFDTTVKVHRRLEAQATLLDSIDRIIAPSPWMKEVLVMNGVQPNKIVVSVYGIRATNGVQPPRIRGRALNFGYIGRIHEMKGVHILLAAFGELGHPNGSTLSIYGSPTPDQFEYAGKLWAVAKDIAGLAFGRVIGPEELSATLDSIDVLVVPSMWYENSPLSILEALQHKTPVIASRVAGIEGVIRDRENGLLFQPGDPMDLASKMQLLIDTPDLVSDFAAMIEEVKTVDADAQLLLSEYQAAISDNMPTSSPR